LKHKQVVSDTELPLQKR